MAEDCPAPLIPCPALLILTHFSYHLSFTVFALTNYFFLKEVAKLAYTMDDPYLDSRSSRRVWEERPRGPFDVNEPLPKPVQLWKSSTNKATNKPQELLHFKWQRNAATRVLESLELHSYEWTVRAIKTRECLDKLDRRDIALSTFAMARNKDIVTTAADLRALHLIAMRTTRPSSGSKLPGIPVFSRQAGSTS